MRIAFFDDSIPFDGLTPDTAPLGGAEKACASLPGALAALGYEVMVYNRCDAVAEIDGVRWLPWQAARPDTVDVLVAFRRPSLLAEVKSAGKRILWATARPDYLMQEATARALDKQEATLVFVGPRQRALYLGNRPSHVVKPGVRRVYLRGERGAADPPVAVSTTHPRHLGEVVDLWVEQIAPQVPRARLLVYSALLSRGEPPVAYAELAEKLDAAGRYGVTVLTPGGDAAMARAFHGARVHLYPGHEDDLACWTLAETQACGVPGVAFPRGGTEDWILNGQSGFIVPDAEAFANVAVQILSDDGVFESQSAAAADPARQRSWLAAAQEFEAVLG